MNERPIPTNPINNITMLKTRPAVSLGPGASATRLVVNSTESLMPADSS